MPELRKDPVVGRWVIIAAERAKRPQDFIPLENAHPTADGKVKLPDPHYSVPELNWPTRQWYDYTIKLNNGQTVGVGVIDHPDNPPATWHNPRYVWMVNPCIVAAGPVQVDKGKTLQLRYRLVVHDGPTPVELLRKLSSNWK